MNLYMKTSGATCRLLAWGVVSLTMLLGASATAADWKAADGPLMTKWGKEVTPENVHREYPRPQMVRKEWTNLDGLWDYAIRPKDDAQPKEFDGKILVPFPVESALSGVMKNVGDANRLWYHRTIDLKKNGDGNHTLLHFGAVDWHAIVYVNGKQVGEHKGGFDPFTFDITDALKDGGEQDLVVSVWDPTDKGTQPRGKQVAKPNSIWYTAVTGIWQTVWLETVPKIHITSLTITPDFDKNEISVTVQIAGAKAEETRATLFRGIDGGEEKTAPMLADKPLSMILQNPKPWSPDSPFLHQISVRLENGDSVDSYFAMRKISLAKDEKGINRLMLNNKPLFQYGPLDQGWWPDGLYTPPSDAALKYDVEVLKKLGCNMIRKHVKVEPDRWYYHCVQLGMLVWQDMPSGDRNIGPRDADIQRTKESIEIYEREWKAIMDACRNHPCIVMWVPFNEGWGQFDTARIVEMTKKYDPTRLVNNASGWNDRGVGDVNDMHNYPGPGMPKVEDKRAVVLGEFGGLGLPLDGHTWLSKGNWGYRSYKNQEELTAAYSEMIVQLRVLIGEGLCAAVYTQTTDVEIEVNGMMTYDRAIQKIPDSVAGLHKKLYLPPPKLSVVMATSQETPQTWKMTTQKPGDDWTKADFDDSKWTAAPGGFGTKITPNTVVRTEWKSDDIWIRRDFELKTADLKDPQWVVHHDEDADIYLNGAKVGTLPGYSTGYGSVPFSKEARAALKAGKNSLAVHVHQTTGGQYIDVGINELIEVGGK